MISTVGVTSTVAVTTDRLRKYTVLDSSTVVVVVVVVVGASIGLHIAGTAGWWINLEVQLYQYN
jgi:hypothetical protein